MRFYDLILKKREGGKLSREEIDWTVQEFTAGRLPDYQMSALLMAIFFRGMDDEETTWLTLAMRDSGDKVDLSRYGRLAADKHSTGGVGDKTSLIVGPLAASLGLKVAKMSGRGLGHTGGTVDKLESIPGFRVTLSPDEFGAQVDHIGLAIVGQSGNLAPADKLIYALRDVTATVESIPLIASSIMSKKLAAGADTIVLDVKVGSGAFMHTLEDARKLAQQMVSIGTRAGRHVSALLTDMGVPLGRAIGNAVEVLEAVEVLKGGGPEELRELCLALASRMTALALDLPAEEADRRAKEALDHGAALDTFRQWIIAQGGDTAFVDTPELLCPAKWSYTVKASRDGWLSATNAAELGRAAMMLGAGRERKTDFIDPSAGILMRASYGDRLNPGDPVCTLLSSTVSDFQEAEQVVRSALKLTEEPPTPRKLIYEVI